MVSPGWLSSRDAAAAVAAVVHAKRWCSAIDLSAIRTGIAEWIVCVTK
jgi:hypothetical protein